MVLRRKPCRALKRCVCPYREALRRRGPLTPAPPSGTEASCSEAVTWCVIGRHGIAYTKTCLFISVKFDCLFCSQDHRLNDLHCINLDTWEWSEMCVPCVCSLISDKAVFRCAKACAGFRCVPQHGPVGRSWHSLTPVSPDHLFLFGGFTTARETLSECRSRSVHLSLNTGLIMCVLQATPGFTASAPTSGGRSVTSTRIVPGDPPQSSLFCR